MGAETVEAVTWAVNTGELRDTDGDGNMQKEIQEWLENNGDLVS
jgi:hypothetical protein